MLKFLLLLGVASAAYFDDSVTAIPGVPDFRGRFQLYSGYLHIKGTIQNFFSSKHLHYVFVTSQRDHKRDPLLVWFNGGPGCSSLFGWLKEHGPHVMLEDDGVFSENLWSWNKEANVLYIESPAGVGFSYCDNHRLCNQHSDASSSLDNLDALLSFFEKFPEYLGNDLYLTGESYAGVYVPYLAFRIDEYNLWLSQNSLEVK